ncbi:hypothetical protein NLX83_02115 [Allokutzneria sp. A3M-2-11 16]|uniref:hypothetical protein n=1 Tax=Allokutzneria sp. A3M-2-11 16 TaxID=2962043 RepID=UPI0020B84A93|nr:hypothetical protein [Allokutzneria sp. A3M-2-11 16]MCP3798044.1 hypothetical protein [Allokutzneria sp. A3M-2-11 16]
MSAEVNRPFRWDLVRRRMYTSPKTHRWHQSAQWTAELPASAIARPSSPVLFARWSWADPEAAVPAHDARTRQALAEAVALVESGRTRETRERLVRAIAAEPAFAEPWLRALVNQLR